jgi:hypothetical protein
VPSKEADERIFDRPYTYLESLFVNERKPFLQDSRKKDRESFREGRLCP